MKTYDTTRNNDYRTFNFCNISKVSGNVVPFAAVAFTQRTLSPIWKRAWWDQTTAAKGTGGNAEDTTTLEQIYGCYIGKRIKQSIIADSLQLKILDWFLVSEIAVFSRGNEPKFSSFSSSVLFVSTLSFLCNSPVHRARNNFEKVEGNQIFRDFLPSECRTKLKTLLSWTKSRCLPNSLSMRRIK